MKKKTEYGLKLAMILYVFGFIPILFEEAFAVDGYFYFFYGGVLLTLLASFLLNRKIYGKKKK